MYDRVYIVTGGTYSDYHIVDVFRTKKDADTFVELLKSRLGDIYEYECDVSVNEFLVSDLQNNVLTRWPDNEVYEVWYDCDERAIWLIDIERIEDVINVNHNPAPEEYWVNSKGTPMYKVCVPTGVCDHEIDTDNLKTNEKLLKVVRDRYAMYKAKLEGVC